jgi:leader peptidase (prepilin peptidase)/N-methyltransferase
MGQVLTTPSWILLIALIVAAWTDLTHRKIYNWTTYPAMVLILAAAAWQEAAAGFQTALLGAAVCGGLMVLAYVCLNVGGGDVKLAAVIGAALGWSEGMHALLWTFTLAGAVAIAAIIWRVGAGSLVRQAVAQFHRTEVSSEQTPEIQQHLRQPLFLAPAALLAVLIVIVPEIINATR